MSTTPALDGVMTAVELDDTASHLASLQIDSGMIPWFEGGHCDPWNHVESAMALDVAGLHSEAEAAYEWLHDVQRPDGSWHAYYGNDESIEDIKLDGNRANNTTTTAALIVRNAPWYRVRNVLIKSSAGIGDALRA